MTFGLFVRYQAGKIMKEFFEFLERHIVGQTFVFTDDEITITKLTYNFDARPLMKAKINDPNDYYLEDTLARWIHGMRGRERQEALDWSAFFYGGLGMEFKDCMGIMRMKADSILKMVDFYDSGQVSA